MRWEILKKGKVKDIVSVLLENRGVENKDEFINPKEPSGTAPQEIGIDNDELKKAIERIKKAKKSKEGVLVFGDYDADGVCATAILWEGLYSYGLNVLPYIPDRFSEGYGLNAVTIKKLKRENANLGLIITVDNGIVAHEAVAAAKKLGVDVIITDHHQAKDTMPKAIAVVHSTEVSGSAIAFILATGVNGRYKKGLELVAIGTVADLLPLKGINRSYVKWGIAALRETKRPGLLAMFQAAGIRRPQIGTYEIGYLIAPRINAAGRIGSAITSLRLICTKRADNADAIALVIEKTNKERQEMVEEHVALAYDIEIPPDGGIVVHHHTFHEGVIGLVASKLVEKHYRPVIVISSREGVAKASARSIDGFNMIENIRALEHLILEGGGHPMAAGFSIERERIGEFADEFGRISRGILDESMLERKLKIDAELMFSQIDMDLMEEINKLEPFGVGNPSPLFSSRRVEIVESKLVGTGGRHVKLKLKQEGQVHSAIGFGMGSRKALVEGGRVDIAYRLQINEWNGRRSVDLVVRDIKQELGEEE